MTVRDSVLYGLTPHFTAAATTAAASVEELPTCVMCGGEGAYNSFTSTQIAAPSSSTPLGPLDATRRVQFVGPTLPFIRYFSSWLAHTVTSRYSVGSVACILPQQYSVGRKCIICHSHPVVSFRRPRFTPWATHCIRRATDAEDILICQFREVAANAATHSTHLARRCPYNHCHSAWR